MQTPTRERFIRCLEACERLGRAAVSGRNSAGEMSFVEHLDAKVAAERERSPDLDLPICNKWVMGQGIQEINKVTKSGLLRAWGFKLTDDVLHDATGADVEFLAREPERTEIPQATLFDGSISVREGVADPFISVLIVPRGRVPLYVDLIFERDQIEALALIGRTAILTTFGAPWQL